MAVGCAKFLTRQCANACTRLETALPARFQPPAKMLVANIRNLGYALSQVRDQKAQAEGA